MMIDADYLYREVCHARAQATRAYYTFLIYILGVDVFLQQHTIARTMIGHRRLIIISLFTPRHTSQ